MTLMMFRNHPHAVIVASVVVVLIGVAALVAVRSTGGPAGDAAPAAKAPIEAGSATAGSTRPERGSVREEPPAVPACASCGIVEAIRTIELRGDAGAQELDQHAAKRVVYRVTVRLEDGSYRTLSQPTPPAIAVGGKVRIVDGAVVPRQ